LEFGGGKKVGRTREHSRRGEELEEISGKTIGEENGGEIEGSTQEKKRTGLGLGRFERKFGGKERRGGNQPKRKAWGHGIPVKEVRTPKRLSRWPGKTEKSKKKVREVALG